MLLYLSLSRGQRRSGGGRREKRGCGGGEEEEGTREGGGGGGGYGKENGKGNERERKRKRDTMRTRLKIMSRRYMNNARMRKSLNGRYIIPTSFSSTVACAYTRVYIIARVVIRCIMAFLTFRRNSNEARGRERGSRNARMEKLK